MDREEFAKLVGQGVDGLPEEFSARLENVDIVVADKPTRNQLRKAKVSPGYIIFGLYEGVPLTKRGIHYGLVPPDKITIFQKSFEEYFSDKAEIVREIEKVVRHEIAHHFGISDERLREIEERH